MANDRTGTESDIVQLRRQARDLLVEALHDHGYFDAQSVHKAMSERKQNGEEILVVPPRSIARYMSEGPPAQPKETTRLALDALGGFAGVREELQAICSKLWNAPQRNEQNEALKAHAQGRRPSLPNTWYQVIPAQEQRPYASIDFMSIEQQSDDSFEGTMLRVSPPAEHGFEWRFTGTRFGVSALYAIFYPTQLNNLISRGTIALRTSGFRSFKYEGWYTRLSENDLSLITRRILWLRSLPQTALPSVAFIDLDNTLREGWSIRPWLSFLARHGMKEAAECASSIQEYFDQYHTNEIDHDQLARDTAVAYARTLDGRSVAEIEDDAELFVRNHEINGIYSFVEPLIESLKQRGVAPIVISGAPRELVKSYCNLLGIEEYYAMALGVDSDGKYNGTVQSNTGVADVKRETIKQVRSAGREAVIGIGDSTSDMPIWNAAKCKIIVGRLEPAPEWPTDRTLTVSPGETSWQLIHEWLSVNLPDMEIPALDESWQPAN